MATPTYLQIADEIKTRIYEIAQGKAASYSFAGRTFTYHNLRDLAQLEQEFRQLALNDANPFGCVTLADVRSTN